MISAIFLFLFLGLIVFGPKKTIELAQTLGKFVAQAKQAAGQFQTDLHGEVEKHTKQEGL